MLRLGQQIRRHISRISHLVCDHHDLTGACDGVNAHMAVHCLLGKSHIDIAGTHNLVYLGDALCSVSQRPHRLGSARLIDHVGSRLMGGNQCVRIHPAVPSRRRYHDNLIHTCCLCRYNIHQHRRGVRRFSSRHIDSHPVKGRHLLSQDRAVRLAVKPAELSLLLMVASDVGKGPADDPHQLFPRFLIGFLYFLFRYLNILCMNLSMVKLCCILKQCFVLFCLYPLQNLCHALLILPIAVGASFQQLFQKIFLCSLIQSFDSHICTSLFRLWLSAAESDP